jgi:hypothetical protein
MNVDVLYSFLMDASWFVLSSWAVFLVLACVVEFRQD